MPPKFKFTREQIITAALDVTRKNGIAELTARGLAAELGSSAKPIFGLFKNMEEVQNEVIAAANRLYQSYLQKGMASGKYPPYKASGIAYIQFAILNIIMKNLGIREDEAFLFHMESWLYVHGIATMIATNYLEWDIEFINKALTDAYLGLKYRYTGGK